jgi:hypothetical protein
MKDIKYIKKYIKTMVTGSIAGCSRCLRFSYHMYGLAVGKLNVYQGTNKVWSLSGNNGDTWNSVFLDIFGGHFLVWTRSWDISLHGRYFGTFLITELFFKVLKIVKPHQYHTNKIK